MGKLIDVFLPWTIFSSLSGLGFWYIIGQTRTNGLSALFDAQCATHSSASYRLQYTGVKAVDDMLCFLVGTFDAALDPSILPFLSYFLVQGAPILGFVSLEAYRKSRSTALAFPVIPGITMQIFTFGATFPIYWAIFISTGAAKAVRSARTAISKAEAQAVVFGQLIGMAIPSICMVVLQDHYVIALWQLIPVYGSILTTIHLLIRPRSQYPQSGYDTIRNMYIIMFILGSSAHLAVLIPKYDKPQALKEFFFPTFVHFYSDSMQPLVLNLLKFDCLFGLGSSLLATLWFAQNSAEVFALVSQILIGLPAFGPGATFAAIALWRETKLHPEEAAKKSK